MIILIITPYKKKSNKNKINPPINIFLLSFLLIFLQHKIGDKIRPQPHVIMLKTEQHLLQHINYGAVPHKMSLIDK